MSFPVNPHIEAGTPVEVYWNLHRHLFSVRDLRTRRVIGHFSDVSLSDVTFKISEAGRQRVLRERRKNVHAFVRGVISEDAFVLRGDPESYSRVTYNPYVSGSFRDAETDEAVSGAAFVRLLSHFDEDARRGTILVRRLTSSL